jgi:hypothetical protein
VVCRGDSEAIRDADRDTETDETRNYGATDREHLVRPEADVFGSDVRRCWPTAGFVRFLQPEAATRAGRLTAERIAATRGTEALRSRLPDLVPTPPRRSLPHLMNPRPNFGS